MPSAQQTSDYDKLAEKLEQAEWRETKAYIESEEKVWFSDIGRLYIRNTENLEMDYDKELLYLEDRFVAETAATGEKIDDTIERILGS